MSNDTCPYCGAEPRAGCTGEWMCGTTKYGDRVRMSDHCETREDLAELRNQLSEVTGDRDRHARFHAEASEQLSELRHRIDQAPVWFAVISSRADGPIAIFPDEHVAERTCNMTPGTCGVSSVRLVRDDQPEETVT